MVAAGLAELDAEGNITSSFADAIVTSDDITPGNGKPHPETFLKARCPTTTGAWCSGAANGCGAPTFGGAGFVRAWAVPCVGRLALLDGGSCPAAGAHPVVTVAAVRFSAWRAGLPACYCAAEWLTAPCRHLPLPHAAGSGADWGGAAILCGL